MSFLPLVGPVYLPHIGPTSFNGQAGLPQPDQGELRPWTSQLIVVPLLDFGVGGVVVGAGADDGVLIQQVGVVIG